MSKPNSLEIIVGQPHSGKTRKVLNAVYEFHMTRPKSVISVVTSGDVSVQALRDRLSASYGDKQIGDIEVFHITATDLARYLKEQHDPKVAQSNTRESMVAIIGGTEQYLRTALKYAKANPDARVMVEHIVGG